MMIKYKKLDEKIWRDFGKKLLNKNDSNLQKDFIKACRDKHQFLSYLKENLFNKEGYLTKGKTIDFEFNEKLTNAQFVNPPQDTQEIIWDKLKKIPHEVKMDCGFWGNIIIELIEAELIEPSYLAARNETQAGLHQIDVALKSEESKEGKKKTTLCIRRILRSMCNPEPRGKRVVFDDFSMGKSYWRWHWADKMSQHVDSLTANDILDIFDGTKYGIFSAKMHSGKSYISHSNILGGLLLSLQAGDDNLRKNLGKVIDKLSYLSAWKAIEVQSPQDNKNEIQTIVSNLKP